jgi:selenocysteine lyase/cysteine desulfurase
MAGELEHAAPGRSLPRTTYPVPALPNSALGEVIAKLAHEQIYVTPRIGRMRISPHVYNDESDVDRFVTTVTRATA